ncbi:MAG: hypothetical protein IPG04_06905 [Polyangiaceae bacterium]|nr:hypothetical protein [Polyangiaceae bacterium]
MSAKKWLGPASFALAALAGAPLTVVLTGCETQAYCFSDCGEGASTSGGGDEGGGGSTGQFTGGGGSTGQFSGGGGEGGGGSCEETNSGVEICDDVDNDCNGQIDDIADIDYDDPKTCGTCANNCYTQLLNVDPATITCTPSDMPGEEPGVCEGDCAGDYHDLNMDGDCEYYCVQVHPTLDVICDGKDDDCDNSIDEDVDLCTSETSCGSCGATCTGANIETSECVKTNADPTCTSANTQCEIVDCVDGWIDLDGSYATGCEYQCTPDNLQNIEYCGDQIDNDCDGLVDAADDVSGDPAIGNVCSGDPDGVCGDVMHEGLTACVGGAVICTGPDVLFENDQLEVCNGLDDDCDGFDDTQEVPSDAGDPCGVSANFPCTLGTTQCVNVGAGVFALDCVGEINPGTETCNGQDDNCDGVIDRVNGMMPADSIGACNVPIPPPVGATSPCVAGTLTCQPGGTIDCVGDVTPAVGAVDSCGVDANCNGVLDPGTQPNTATDPLNCGMCGNNCNANQAVNHNIRTCVNSMCDEIAGNYCLPGYYDLDNNGTCEYACTFVSATEACNGQDDDCDGFIDSLDPQGMAAAPSPALVCDVSPAASRPECTTNVAVSCNAGTWQCTFPANVCSGATPCSGSSCCNTPAETCDGLDNDCDGLFNENVPDFGLACASDDGLPLSHGACQTFGTRVCSGPSATTCNAMAANCSGLPGGCTEVCDGVDNDCDGVTDEPYTAKGSNVANFYRPKVIQVRSNVWMYQQEASRPNASATVPGSGNGYWTTAPPGETVDETASCSEPSKIPWFNVTPAEAEQTCVAAGGFLCSTAEWRDGCHVEIGGTDCLYGYGPLGAACTSTQTASKYCNIGPFDFNAGLAGDQDGLLPTRSASLQNCYSDWRNQLTNPNTVNGQMFDIGGNLREITSTGGGVYTLMGGGFNSATESGTTCDFTFYAVDDEFKFPDTGFRCCFSANPTL